MGYDVCTRYAEKAVNCRHHIPDELSFDRIIEGKTLPPASLADFMVYLLYVSRDAETLQFFLWLKDYTRRFNDLAEHDTLLSPSWNPIIKKGTRLHNPGTEHVASSRTLLSKESFETDETFLEKKIQAQPYRVEINRIIQHYLLPRAPRELNLSYRVRDAVLQALETTTHPSAFKPCSDLVEQCLRNQSHPNFVRWAIENGRRPRTIILRQLCATSFIFYGIGQIFLILSGRCRWYRLALAPILFLGLLLLQAMFHGFCLLLYATGTRELRLWEMFASDEEVEAARKSALPLGIPLVPQNDSTTNVAEKPSNIDMPILDISTKSKGILPYTRARLNPFGPRNDFEHESWRNKWKRTPWYRRYSLTFTSCKTNLAERAITAYQGKIVLQSVAIATVLMILISTAFIFIPEVTIL
ncbi:MAG: hypothetical protein GOMPHAMPRED_007934 [Gomphillus americanus]|uniref:RGS domain-containing protein n=1 Tax=Gomphillus americanus TaxID=1940652 RepID=A0A8H3EU32_9LECA|nr:MAG: hypothetical protein GOMPHAMPRED_007934 [Gomphillus americanus]